MAVEEEVRRNALAAMLEDGGHFWRQTQSGRAWQIVSQIAIQTSLPLDASLPLTPTTSKCIFNTILLLLFDNEAGILLHFSNFFSLCFISRNSRTPAILCAKKYVD